MQHDPERTGHLHTVASELQRGLAVAWDILVRDGVIAGAIGAATIAVWFLLLDAMAGRPLHTPTVLGTALFQRGELLVSMDAMPVSLSRVLQYSVVHWLVFIVMGGVASCGLRIVAREQDLAFGFLLLFVLLVWCEFGFRLARVFLFAHPEIPILTWLTVLPGNFLACAAIGVYLLRRHHYLDVTPGLLRRSVQRVTHAVDQQYMP